MVGEFLIVWTARVAVALYVARVAVDLLVADPLRRERWARLAWTAGCGVYLMHVAFAFQFLHGWSHAAALAHTARRTFEVVGLHWGGGIYVNYAFSLLWLADVAWWWKRSQQPEPTPAVIYWSVQAIFAFMMFNATVVFGPPFWKWFAVVVAVVLIGVKRKCVNARVTRAAL